MGLCLSSFLRGRQKVQQNPSTRRSPQFPELSIPSPLVPPRGLSKDSALQPALDVQKSSLRDLRCCLVLGLQVFPDSSSSWGPSNLSCPNKAQPLHMTLPEKGTFAARSALTQHQQLMPGPAGKFTTIRQHPSYLYRYPPKG